MTSEFNFYRFAIWQSDFDRKEYNDFTLKILFVFNLANQDTPCICTNMTSVNHVRRKDIDGLRAIAVLSVILFHYGLPGLQGGFVGVDIFFVISGYLITKQLATICEDTFSPTKLIDFYRRRIKRIFPTLIVVLFVTLIAGWYLLLPFDYAALGNSTLFSSFGLGNFYFFLNTDYFDRPADFQPLLHTWSLGVEEQFYLLWPAILSILILISKKYNAKILFILACVVIGGLVYAELTVWVDTKSAFYLPVPRAWELLVGAFVAFLPDVKNKTLANVIGLLGLILIFYSIVKISAGPTSLALNMLPAVAGSAMVVSQRNDSCVSRVLEISPSPWIGRISYSLYLWHWPVLVFYRHISAEHFPSLLIGCALVVISFLLATLSYYIIEQPFSRSRSSKTVVGICVAAALVGFFGAVVKFMDGLPARLPTRVQQFAQGGQDYSSRRDFCHRTDKFNPPLNESCRFGVQTAPPSIAVWGDSHGVEFAHSLGDIVEMDGRSVLGMTYTSCPPAQDFQSPFQKGCQIFNREVLEYLKKEAFIDTVVIGSYFELYLRSINHKEFRDGFERTIASLRGKRIFILATNPETGYSIPKAAARLAMLQEVPTINLPIEKHLAFALEARTFLEELAYTYPNVEILDPAEVLCDINCHFIIEGHVTLFDADHLSMTAAKMVANHFRSYFTVSSSDK